MFIVGDGFYGKVDALPGHFHIGTRFLHFWWIPLVPRESYLFVGDASELATYRLRVPLSWKSVFVGWSRGILLMFAALYMIGTTQIVANGEWARPTGWWIAGLHAVVAIVFYGLYRLTFRMTPASFARAVQLGHVLGIPQREIERTFGLDPGAAAISETEIRAVQILPEPEVYSTYVRPPYRPFIVGDGLFGKTDVVRGLFHVRTLFWHFCFVPIIPKSSYLIPGDKASGFDRGIRIPMSGRSLFIAWTRGGLGVVLFFIALIVGAVLPLDFVPWSPIIAYLVIFLVLLSAWILVSRLQKCSFGRALELAAVLKINPGEVERRFGEIPVADDDPMVELPADTSDGRIFRRRGEWGADS